MLPEMSPIIFLPLSRIRMCLFVSPLSVMFDPMAVGRMSNEGFSMSMASSKEDTPAFASRDDFYRDGGILQATVGSRSRDNDLIEVDGGSGQAEKDVAFAAVDFHGTDFVSGVTGPERVVPLRDPVQDEFSFVVGGDPDAGAGQAHVCTDEGFPVFSVHDFSFQRDLTQRGTY